MPLSILVAPRDHLAHRPGGRRRHDGPRRVAPRRRRCRLAHLPGIRRLTAGSSPVVPPLDSGETIRRMSDGVVSLSLVVGFGFILIAGLAHRCRHRSRDSSPHVAFATGRRASRKATLPGSRSRHLDGLRPGQPAVISSSATDADAVDGPRVELYRPRFTSSRRAAGVTTFSIEPRGRFSLAAAQDFAGGFAAGIGAHGTATGLLMTFPVEGWRDSAAVDVWQTADGIVHGEVAGSDDIETVRRQAARSLSLDHDGAGWEAIGQRDPVLGTLQARYDWLRPVCFYSAYEAATSFVIGQRIAMRQARVVKDHLAAELGDPIEIGGQVVRPFPRPQRLVDITEVQGISAAKVARLRDLARAALDGVLDTERLRALPEDEALTELRDAAGRRPMDRPGDPDARLWRRRLPAARRRDQPDRRRLDLRSPGTARRRHLDRDVRRVAPVPDVGDGPAAHGLASRAGSHAQLSAEPLGRRALAFGGAPRGPRPGPPRDVGRAVTAPACAGGSTAGSPRRARRRR